MKFALIKKFIKSYIYWLIAVNASFSVSLLVAHLAGNKFIWQNEIFYFAVSLLFPIFIMFYVEGLPRVSRSMSRRTLIKIFSWTLVVTTIFNIFLLGFLKK